MQSASALNHTGDGNSFCNEISFSRRFFMSFDFFQTWHDGGRFRTLTHSFVLSQPHVFQGLLTVQSATSPSQRDEWLMLWFIQTLKNMKGFVQLHPCPTCLKRGHWHQATENPQFCDSFQICRFFLLRSIVLSHFSLVPFLCCRCNSAIVRGVGKNLTVIILFIIEKINHRRGETTLFTLFILS